MPGEVAVFFQGLNKFSHRWKQNQAFEITGHLLLVSTG